MALVLMTSLIGTKHPESNTAENDTEGCHVLKFTIHKHFIINIRSVKCKQK